MNATTKHTSGTSEFIGKRAPNAIIAAAHSFARKIPEVQFLSVGQTLPKTSSWVDASFDVCFVMRFEDKAAMDRYGKNPVHQKAAQEVFLPLSQKIMFYDFTSE
jgi:hypothetical protein